MRDSETKIIEVSSSEELANAINTVSDGGTIKLTQNITADINLAKLVNIDLNEKTLTGNVGITSDTSGTLNISNGTITGDLTVDTPNATVNNVATVNGITTVGNVSENTFNNTGILNTVNITDPNGGSFNNTGKINGVITISPSSEATAPIILKGNITGEVKVTGNKKPQVKVEGKVASIKIEAENTKLEIAKEAEITNPLIINKEVTIISAKPINAKINKNIKVTIKDKEQSKGREVIGEGQTKEVKLEAEKSLYTFNTKLDKAQYTVDEDITIEGTLLNVQTALDGVDITLKLEDVKGNLVSVGQTKTEKDGKFTHTFNFPEGSEAGTYTLTIKANDPVNQSMEEKLIIVATK